ncbi:MAG: L-2-amino-thiazoline-4-carboxylic acid hydrolase [Alphaproteobacteria bacterium]|nr:L-2-amino-thiazoline-4-carboxylic acid hydrolase [Alphaproteobacteria bacterium]
MTTAETMIPISVLRAALKMRAAAYAHMFDVMREQLGLEKALEIGQEATRRLGASMGNSFSEYGPDDLAGLKDAFLAGIPGGDELFIPEVVKCDADELEIYFQKCPLKDTWTELGRSDEDLEHLCEFAGAIDAGMFTSAGFVFAGDTWKPGEPGCCRLRVRPGSSEN